MLKKRCTKCERSRNVDQFHKNRKSKDGLFSWCKICTKDAKNKITHKLAKQRQNQERYIKLVMQKYPEIHKEIGLLCTKEPVNKNGDKLLNTDK